MVKLELLDWDDGKFSIVGKTILKISPLFFPQTFYEDCGKKPSTEEIIQEHNYHGGFQIPAGANAYLIGRAGHMEDSMSNHISYFWPIQFYRVETKEQE